jgi:hypothetical protein
MVVLVGGRLAKRRLAASKDISRRTFPELNVILGVVWRPVSGADSGGGG